MASNTLTYQGVQYDLAGAKAPTLSIDDLRGNYKYVRIQWVDLINNIRFRVIPMPYFLKLLMTSRPGTSLTKASLGIVFVTIVEGFSATGEYLYAIDLSTLKQCPYAPGHASVMGWFEEKEPIAGLVGHRAVEVDLCPRTILRRVVDNAKQISGIEFLVGFETEFILLKKTMPVEAINQHGWCNAPALPSGTKEAQILEEIAEALAISGVEVQMYHAEAAPGQYEVVTGPLPPLQAVDALIHTRETIFNIASKHGLRATLAPRVFLDNCGSAAHAHISVHAPKEPPRPSAHEHLTDLEATFLAGVLEHLPSLTLLALPTSASYQRMMDGVWSGGTYVCWGTDNREAPIRLCNASSPSSRNFELKTLDGTANPYLALAAVLGAGLEGVIESKELVIKNCNGENSAAMLGEKGRAELGITERLPLNWEEARSKFESSSLVDNVFGKEFKAKFLSVNKGLKEQLTFGLMDDEALKLLVETY
jgi:glutamine synthetase